MNYIKCPHCGFDTPAILSHCENCHEIISNKRLDNSSEANYVLHNPETHQKKKYEFKKFIFLGLVMIILVIAAVRNPSVTESKQLIKDAAITEINEKFIADINDDNISGSYKFGSMLGMLLGPLIIDKLVTIDVNDYIIFSTFKATLEGKGEKMNLASGIILFGNLIPISSDINNSNYEIDDSDL